MLANLSVFTGATSAALQFLYSKAPQSQAPSDSMDVVARTSRVSERRAPYIQEDGEYVCRLQGVIGNNSFDTLYG